MAVSTVSNLCAVCSYNTYNICNTYNTYDICSSGQRSGFTNAATREDIQALQTSLNIRSTTLPLTLLHDDRRHP